MQPFVILKIKKIDTECPGGSPLGQQKEKPLAFPLNQIHIFWDSVANFIRTVDKNGVKHVEHKFIFEQNVIDF